MTGALWTVDQVAEFLSMSKSWVYKAAEQGSLPCVRIGASLRFFPAEIEKWLHAQRTGGQLLSMR